jgi:hypothetical protein
VTAIAAIALLNTRNWRYIGYASGGLCVLAALAVIALFRQRCDANSDPDVFTMIICSSRITRGTTAFASRACKARTP